MIRKTLTGLGILAIIVLNILMINIIITYISSGKLDSKDLNIEDVVLFIASFVIILSEALALLSYGIFALAENWNDIWYEIDELDHKINRWFENRKDKRKDTK